MQKLIKFLITKFLNIFYGICLLFCTNILGLYKKYGYSEGRFIDRDTFCLSYEDEQYITHRKLIIFDSNTTLYKIIEKDLV